MACSLLESLPAELKYEVFTHITDLPTLKSLVCSAPVFHSHYRAYRISILRNCLAHEMQELWPDAVAAFNSRDLSLLDSPTTDEKVTEFMHQYGDWVSNPKLCPDIRSTPDEVLQKMAGYHLTVARPLTGALGNWAKRNFKKALAAPTGWFDLPPPPETTLTTKDKPLSRGEETRIRRALYRYETYHHLFGTTGASGCSNLRHDEVNAVFFSPFTPWDAEGLSCVDNFVRAQYQDKFTGVAANFRCDDPRLLEAFHEQDFMHISNLQPYHLDGIVARGLETLASLLASKTHTELVDKVPLLLTGNMSQDDALRQILTRTAQFDRRTMPNRLVTPADNAEQRREIMEFGGDENPDQVPWGWMLLWDGVYANLYGRYVPRRLWGIGLVFWDKEHWDNIDGTGLMSEEWSNDRQLVEAIGRDFGWSPQITTTEVQELAVPHEEGKYVWG